MGFGGQLIILRVQRVFRGEDLSWALGIRCKSLVSLWTLNAYQFWQASPRNSPYGYGGGLTSITQEEARPHGMWAAQLRSSTGRRQSQACEPWSRESLTGQEKGVAKAGLGSMWWIRRGEGEQVGYGCDPLGGAWVGVGRWETWRGWDSVTWGPPQGLCSPLLGLMLCFYKLWDGK